MPAILDVAIGTIFVFLLFSFVVSVLNEYILSLFDQRAKFLRLGLAELFGASVAPKVGAYQGKWPRSVELQQSLRGFGSWLLQCFTSLGGLRGGGDLDVGKKGQQLLEHGLINAFSRTDGGVSPSYIPAGAFVTALLDIVVHSPSTLWAAADAAPLSTLITAIRAARAQVPAATAMPPALYTGALTPFITAYAALPVPAPASMLARFHYRVAESLANPEPQANKTAAKTAALAAIAARAALPIPSANLTPLLSAMEARASRDIDLFKQLLQGFDTPVTPVNFDAELTDLDAAAAGAIALIAAPTLKHTAEAIEASLNSLPESKLRESLLSLFRTVDGDVQRFKLAVEGWFNGVMDRVSGWYKRFAQKWMITFGFVIAAACNVDTIEIVRVLSNNPNLAKAVADQATTYAATQKKPLDDAELEKQRNEKLNAVVAAAGKLKAIQDAGGATPEQRTAAQDDLDKATADANALTHFKAAVARLQETGLPIGWTKDKFAKAGGTAFHVKGPEFGDGPGSSVAEGICWFLLFVWRLVSWPFVTLWALRVSIPGWFLTAIAASLGAPFWFDLLGRFVNIRAAGKAPGEKEPTSTPTRPPPASLDTTPGTHAPAR